MPFAVNITGASETIDTPVRGHGADEKANPNTRPYAGSCSSLPEAGQQPRETA